MLGRPALSFSNNPAFRRLVEGTIRGRRIVILCGAGVTADAGLPTWSLLLSRIASQRAGRNDQLAPLVPANEADLARAAGLLLRRAGHGRGRTTPDYAAVATALYDDQPPPPSTYLAQRIIDLVAGRGERTIALATTNYDDLLEVAAHTSGFEPVPLTLDGADEWWASFAQPTDPVLPIYHLHGYLGRDDDRVLRPIVITEDQFYREGWRVQADLRRMIVEADLVLCVGVSLTDANLVGALASLPRSDDGVVDPPASKVFVVSVAGPVAESATPAQAERYTVERASYLHEVFGVEVVPLNSYGQVGQLMIELELALSQPEEYQRTDALGIRYGFRLARGLETAYRSVGWPTDGSEPTGDALAFASDALDAVLDAIRPALSRLVLRSEHERLLDLAEGLRSAPDLQAHFEAEGLGLFLWMPTPFEPHVQDSPRPYSLQLVAASAYTHRELWSFRRKPVGVNAYASETAAKATFTGQPVIEPTTVTNEPRLWRTNIGVPLSATPVDGDGSTVALGAVVLASDRRLPTPSEVDQGQLDDEDLAGVSYLSPGQRTEYCRVILEETTRLLTSAR